MLSKKVLKYIQSLGLKKSREETGLFIAEGPKIVEELIQLIPEQIDSVYALDDWTYAIEKDKIIRISHQELEKISQLQTPNKVVATIRQFQPQKPQTDGFILYLDAIQDPGNFGTIIM